MEWEYPFDYFDEIYCINLDKRTDRWEECKKEFSKIDLLEDVERFSAVEKKDGRVGIIKSNLEIVKMAKEKGLENVLVFEDDVKFINNPLVNLKKSLDQIPEGFEWDLFYIGANTHVQLDNLTENLAIVKNSFAVHAMAYSHRVFDEFIEYAEAIPNYITNQQDVLDVWLANKIQARGKSLLCNPILATQRESFSDIERRKVNYKFIEERAKQNLI